MIRLANRISDYLDDDFISDDFEAYSYDPVEGLQFNNIRHYDPTIGRWMSEDPTGFETGINLYRYVGNGPA